MGHDGTWRMIRETCIYLMAYAMPPTPLKQEYGWMLMLSDGAEISKSLRHHSSLASTTSPETNPASWTSRRLMLAPKNHQIGHIWRIGVAICGHLRSKKTSLRLMWAPKGHQVGRLWENGVPFEVIGVPNWAPLGNWGANGAIWNSKSDPKWCPRRDTS